MKIKILSPAKEVSEIEAKALVVPGVEGYLGILPGHGAMITELKPGAVVVEKSAGGNEAFFVSGGYVQVDEDQIMLLGDVVEHQSEIDLERAKDALKRATENLRNISNPEIVIDRALAAEKRASERMLLVK